MACLSTVYWGIGTTVPNRGTAPSAQGEAFESNAARQCASNALGELGQEGSHFRSLPGPQGGLASSFCRPVRSRRSPGSRRWGFPSLHLTRMPPKPRQMGGVLAYICNSHAREVDFGTCAPTVNCFCSELTASQQNKYTSQAERHKEVLERNFWGKRRRWGYTWGTRDKWGFAGRHFPRPERG